MKGKQQVSNGIKYITSSKEKPIKKKKNSSGCGCGGSNRQTK